MVLINLNSLCIHTYHGHLLYVHRKQRKGNGVKRVCKEALSRSDSEDGSSDEEIDVLGDQSQNDENLTKELEWKTGAGYTARRATAYPRAAKRNAGRKQTEKQQQKSETRTSDNKNKKKNKGRNVKSRVNIRVSKAIEEPSSSGADKDLAIDVEAFVHHGPVVEDIDRAAAAVSVSCPFCSKFCRDKQDVIQHIKECHHSGENNISLQAQGFFWLIVGEGKSPEQLNVNRNRTQTGRQE